MTLSVNESYGLIIPVCGAGILYSIFNAWKVSQVDVEGNNSGGEYSKMIEGTNDDGRKIADMNKIGKLIQNGSDEFLLQEYKYMTVFCLAFSVIILVAVDIVGNENNFQMFTTLAFLTGCITSIISGWIGMKIATYANTRTAYMARFSLSEAFQVAFRSGCVMGFSLTSLGLLVLTILIAIYRATYRDIEKNPQDLKGMMECVAGYGLGGSTIALFGRVGGGIYTKAADVGADLVGKVENDFAEDSPNNPATIADNVGDNVGDIAGMGADLFGSFAEATSAALAISAVQPDFYGKNEGAALFYPLFISAFGIIGCFVTSIFATDIMKVNENDQIESTLKYQIRISTILLTPLLYVAAAVSLPDDFIVDINGSPTSRSPVHAFICSLCGLWAGQIIGEWTEYCTSHSYSPVREVANACQTGAATNIIYGLALGYMSNTIPIVALGACSFVCVKLMGMLGVALGALGMLSNLGCSLAIDAYGPISDNAGGIAEMSELGESVRARTDALDAAGNTTAAIGKGFAIGSAALVSLALYGAFVTRARAAKTTDHVLGTIEVLDAMVFCFLLVGAMLPYWFSAMTMKSVGSAALEMVKEVRRQLHENPKIKTGECEPDYQSCIRISTAASLKEMIAPGALVIFTPMIVGLLFGPKAVAGLLPGALISGVQIAISASNTGGAWDNAKKYIESGQLEIDGVVRKKGSEEHKAAVIGDTVGDPLKDTSGPALNILIKLMAILSLVFCDFFCKTGYLVCPLDEQYTQAEC